jgi:hypothetical protein
MSHMRLLSPILIALAAAVAAGHTTEKILTLHKTPAPILLDGAIDAIWSTADSTDKFFQLQPYPNRPPTYRTVAKLLTTDENLYCLMVCYEAATDIQNHPGIHDQGGGDIVSLMLDTFGDKKSAYKFAVTAAGVRADCRLLDDARNRDYNWGSVWFAASQVYDWGFVVEMEIPYKSIRYDGTLTEWGLDFDRWIPAKTEDLYWCSYEQNEGQRVSKFGRLLLNGAKPAAKGLNLEVYPVAIARATYINDGKYKIDPDAGIDIFYNPSEQLTFQLTGNPDFAQIEADPYEFNISRYETYFSERRPFFTEGNEIFMASGKEQNSGFYSPLQLFYSRRIGKVLSDGTLVPLQLGTKVFGRLGAWEYGGFLAMTGETEYTDDGSEMTENKAVFTSARLKRQILGNSSIGGLFVGKHSDGKTSGVIDVDGAFRTTEWQLSYQLARSIQNTKGDYAGSAGFVMFGDTWVHLIRARAVGKDFDISEVGYVPWSGTANMTAGTGPIWYPKEGYISKILLLGGFSLNYEDADLYTDHSAILDFNMQFRDNWGYEITLLGGRSRDQGQEYPYYEVDFSSWFNTSPRWHANVSSGYAKAYNFAREYLAAYWWFAGEFEWKALNTLELGTSFGVYTEEKPDGGIEEMTLNARPFLSFSPINHINLRLYVDNLYLRSSDRLEYVVAGFLLSYNFLPRSWVYLALNEVQERSSQTDGAGNLLPVNMHTTNRAAVAKVKYLYYF